MKRKTARKKSNSKKNKSSYRRGLWKGSIAFGLVNIPIFLESAQQEKKIHFKLIDKRDLSPIGYKQINKVTGREVNKASIVKGYEYEKGQYVLLSDSDFEKANVKATRTMDIEDFVDLEEIDPMLFSKPYYILPQQGGEKSYLLLREVLEKTNKAAIAKIVLHTVQHLVAIIPREDYLILEVLRFANEIKEVREMDFDFIEGRKVSEREVNVAEQLVEGMTTSWKPEKYHDDYREDLMKLINSKIRRGATAELEQVEIPESKDETDNVIDLTALLKKSLSAAKNSSRKKTSTEKRLRRGA